MSDLPPLAWVLLCAVGVVIVVLNLALVALVRNRDSLKNSFRPPPPSRSAPNLDRMVSVLRDPFAEERKQLDELSGLVHHLDEKKTPPDKP